ncbi:MAG: hypothetical protein QHH80_02350 [Anaerolineae bacterium]|nr:hypothetical protein [Anaerolineae bacterium]
MTKADKLIWAIAILQFIPTLMFPPAVLTSARITVLALPILLFAFLGWGLVRRRPWALTLSVFVQGFNVIVRVLMLLPRVVVAGKLDVAWLVASILAVILSLVFLFLLEKPDVQIAITA